MRIFVTGKGGVGKTTLAAALSAVLRDAGSDVVAIDADGSPNLALAIGAGDPEELPAVANQTPPRRDHSCDSEPLDLDTIIDRFSVQAGNGVQLVQTGRIERPSERCLCCGSHATTREVVAAMPTDAARVVVVDLEPGANDLLWAHPKPGDTVVLVTDASKRSVETARRLLGVIGELGIEDVVLIANRVRPDEALTLRSAFEGRELLEIPFEADVSASSSALRGAAQRIARRVAEVRT